MLKNDEGQSIEDAYQLQILVKDYFSKLFAAYYQWKEWKHTKVSFPALNDADIQKLKEPLSDEEIKRVVFSMKPWKAPNPDGFPMVFYQKLWILWDIMCVILCMGYGKNQKRYH